MENPINRLVVLSAQDQPPKRIGGHMLIRIHDRDGSINNVEGAKLVPGALVFLGYRPSTVDRNRLALVHLPESIAS